jgi:hypothetical protein
LRGFSDPPKFNIFLSLQYVWLDLICRSQYISETPDFNKIFETPVFNKIFPLRESGSATLLLYSRFDRRLPSMCHRSAALCAASAGVFVLLSHAAAQDSRQLEGIKLCVGALHTRGVVLEGDGSLWSQRLMCALCLCVHVRVPSLQEVLHAGGGANHQTGPGGCGDVRV